MATDIIALTTKAAQSKKVKLACGHERYTAKFYGASTEQVTLTEGQYQEMREWFNRSDWELTPNVTSEGFTARKPGEVNLVMVSRRSIVEALGY
jgi:hypothetical protein